MPRFAVQKHFRDRDDFHYDLMIECGEVLLTWQSGAPPDAEKELPCLVRQLPDHRAEYLDYQGPVGSDRGWCEIHDRGTFQWVEPPDGLAEPADCDLQDILLVRLDGGRVRGTFRLKREPMTGTDYWRLARTDD